VAVEVQAVAVSVVIGTPRVLVPSLIAALFTPIVASVVAVGVPRPARLFAVAGDLAVLEVRVAPDALDLLRLPFRFFLGVLLVLLDEALEHALQTFARDLVFANWPDGRQEFPRDKRMLANACAWSRESQVLPKLRLKVLQLLQLVVLAIPPEVLDVVAEVPDLNTKHLGPFFGGGVFLLRISDLVHV